MKAAGIIFSNIHDKEIKELTANRTLASVPFGGRFRLIDFVLSNMVNSGITKVGIITKENYQSLMDHVGSGKHWDLSRKNGGLILLPPYGMSGTTLYKSRFEAICNTEQFLRRSEEDLVVMSDCDNVCNLDIAKVLAEHVRSSAEITVVYRRKTLSEAAPRDRTLFELNPESGRVTRTMNVSKAHGEHNVFTNMLVAGRRFLLSIIDNAPARGFTSFSKDILTRTGEFRIFGYPLEGYFASIDDLQSYYRISMNLLKKENRDMLFYQNGANIYTKVRDSAPLVTTESADIANSIIADGCVVEGEVKNSILFRGVRVSKGASVTDSILFQDSCVGRDTRLNCVVADKQAVILEKRTLSGHETHPYFIAKNSVI
ncbi:MAG: glucose-1-phosphate adenylyltransferase subunit GlgD [Firmicutes bacterium]|nr:glucose-1-phosphate adenylyltransferase subunit GlgD [Bacillota bacterium]